MINDTTKKAPAKGKEVVKEVPTDVVDLDLSAIQKKRIRINGDNTKMLELNISDMNIISRISEAYPKLDAIQDKVMKYAKSDASSEDLSANADALKEFDKEMRDLVDFIFNANVSEVCADDGSMYDPMGGMFRYEYIVERLMNLYSANLNKEFMQMKARVNKYAKKK